MGATRGTRAVQGRCLCGAELAGGTDLGEGTKVLGCRACGLLSRDRLPPEEETAAWYRDGYWAAYRAEQTGPGRRGVHAHAVDWLGSRLRGPVTLVDVGCGGGSLLELCRERGWTGIGVDLSADAVAHARARGLQARQLSWPPCPLGDGSVDAVTLVNVLDHLPDPSAALREAARVLRPGGHLYLRVPNGPWHVRLVRILSLVGLRGAPVVHLYGFGRRAIRHYLRQAGLEPLSVRTSPPTDGVAYPDLRRWMKLLLRIDRGVYRALAWLRLDEQAYGLSIEAMAVKPVPSSAAAGASRRGAPAARPLAADGRHLLRRRRTSIEECA